MHKCKCIEWVGGGGVATIQATATWLSIIYCGGSRKRVSVRTPMFALLFLLLFDILCAFGWNAEISQKFSDRNIWQCKLTKSSFTLIESFFPLSIRRQSPNQRDTCRWRRRLTLLSPFVISTVCPTIFLLLRRISSQKGNFQLLVSVNSNRPARDALDERLSLCHGVAFGKARSSVTEQTSRTAARLREINALRLSVHLLSRRNVVKTVGFAWDWGTESRRRRRNHSRCTWTQGYYNGSRGGFPLPPRARLDELAPGSREQPSRRLLEQLKHPVSGFISFLQRVWGDLALVRRLTRRERGRKDRGLSRITCLGHISPENNKKKKIVVDFYLKLFNHN